jgi:hypothetical protein
MNKNTNDGGPAFPTQNGTRNDQGMTLRDWFAGMALQGMLASCRPGYSYQIAEDATSEAFRYADAMLSARDGKGEE